jgi:hypothetical protein
MRFPEDRLQRFEVGVNIGNDEKLQVIWPIPYTLLRLRFERTKACVDSLPRQAYI